MSDKLKGQYGFPVAVSMVVGIVIGIGIFFKTSQILLATELNSEAAITAWILGGLISVLSGLTVAEIGAAIPETGGSFAWIRKIYGDKLAFLVGWAQVTIYNPAIIALISYYFAYFTMQFLGIEANMLIHISISFGAMIFVYLINIYTKNVGGKLQTVVTVAKIIPIFLIIIFGFIYNTDTVAIQSNITPETTTSGKSFWLLVGTAILPIMFAFDGWIYVGTIAGDLKNPKRDLPKAIIFGLSFVALVYISLNLALLNVYSPEILVEKGIFGVAEEVFGTFGSKFIYAGIVVSAFGGLNGFTLVSTRVPYSLADEKLFPKSEYFSKIEDKTGQPLRSSYLMMALSLAYLIAMFISGEVDAFGDIPIALIWIFYTLIFIGLIVLRKKQPNLERPYKVPLYPVIPILAIVGGFTVGISALISQPWYFALSIIVTLLGLVFYKQK
jgi:APA family basic amino acid/polyamine antiporter